MTNSYPMLARYVIPDMPSAQELMPWLKQIDENRWYSNFGPLVTQFEDRMTMHLSSSEDKGAAPIALTTMTTCYHALVIGLQLFRLPPNARVLVPAVTFPACPLAVRHAGAEAILGDVDNASWHLTPQIARRIAAKTPIHAVMPVAVYGVPVSAEEWDAFTADTGIPVIIDAAATVDTQKIPKKAMVACSLHATKPFAVGEGGLLITRDRDVIDEARMISNFGTQSRIVLRDGVNAKMSEYHGAVALAQLGRWEDIKKRRRTMFQLYRKYIEAVGIDLTLQKGVEDTVVSSLMLRVPSNCAATIVNALNSQSIAGHRMYLPPLYHHPYLAQLAVADSEGRTRPGTASLEEKVAIMTNSEALHQSVFGIPFHAFLGEEDIGHIVSILTQVMDSPEAKTKAG